MADLTMAPFTELLELLETAGVHATMDAGEVNTPGAWLTFDDLRRHTVRGVDQLRCSLYLITGDRDAGRAIAELGPMLNKVRTVLTPDGAVRAVQVVLPHGPTPLPALQVPVFLYATP